MGRPHIVRAIGVSGILVIAIGAIWVLFFEDKHVAKGRRLYAYYCADCHGRGGKGDGYNAKNLDPIPRDHTDSAEPYMAERTNEELFEAISKGGREISKSPFMPPFENTLSEEEMWSLVAYLRTLHPNKAEEVKFTEEIKAKKPRFPSPTREEFRSQLAALTGGENPGEPSDGDKKEQEERLIRIGKRLFEEKYGCISCHRVGEAGGQVGPELTRAGVRLKPDYIYRWARNPQGIKSATKMPNFGLPERDAVAVTLYLGTLRGTQEESKGCPRVFC